MAWAKRQCSDRGRDRGRTLATSGTGLPSLILGRLIARLNEQMEFEAPCTGQAGYIYLHHGNTTGHDECFVVISSCFARATIFSSLVLIRIRGVGNSCLFSYTKIIYCIYLSSYLSCNILFVLYYELVNYSLISYTNNMDKQYDNKISNLF